jgi:UDP-GlcNAc:undecaprenyl-phosphate GlcNAc-1-phosphate transferase
LRRGRISTGLMKAVGGGIVGFVVAYLLSGSIPHPRLSAAVVLNGLLIILSANTLNLLDLRPGRAVSCFWVGILAVMFIWPERNATLLALMPVLVPSVILLLLDRSARVMIGDAGSNVLGAVLGIGIALRYGVPVKIGVLLFLVLVNVYSERFSISKLIEGNRVLRSVDRLLGER